MAATTDTFASWKRHLQIGGTIRVENFLHPEANGVREVVKVQSKSMASRLSDGRLSWVDYPKAAHCLVDGRTLTFFGGTGIAFTYTILEGSED